MVKKIRENPPDPRISSVPFLSFPRAPSNRLTKRTVGRSNAGPETRESSVKFNQPSVFTGLKQFFRVTNLLCKYAVIDRFFSFIFTTSVERFGQSFDKKRF
jgi:hypothetical protein